MELESVKLIAAALALLPMFAVALGLGMIFSSYNEGVARNPNATELLDKKFFLCFALTEALAIFALLISLIILFVF